MKLTKKERQREKLALKAKLQAFVRELQGYVQAGDGQWTLKGFIDIKTKTRSRHDHQSHSATH